MHRFQKTKTILCTLWQLRSISSSNQQRSNSGVLPQFSRQRRAKTRSTDRIKKLDPVFPEKEPRPAKKPTGKGSQTVATFEDNLKGKATFVQHNRKTVDEFEVETRMQGKVRVKTLYDQRNGLPMCSLGDKVYKAVEYQTGFFKRVALLLDQRKSHTDH